MISIELVKESFYCGSEVKGQLVFDPCEESTVIFGVVIQLIGVENIIWTKAIPLKTNVFYNQTKAIAGHEVDTFPDGSVDLKYPGYQEPINITKKTRFDFTFLLSGNMLSSFKYGNSSLEYSLRGYVVPIFGSAYTCKKPIIIGGQVSSIDLDSIPRICTAQGPYYFKHQLDFNVVSDIKISARLDKPVTWFGDEVKLTISLDLKFNSKKTHIKMIRAKLRQVISFGTIGNLSMHVMSQSLCKVTHRDHDVILRNGHHEINMVIPIKNLAIQPDVNAKNFKCGHYIMVKIPTRLGDQVFVKVPLVVEKLPRLSPPDLTVSKQASLESIMEPRFTSSI